MGEEIEMQQLPFLYEIEMTKGDRQNLIFHRISGAPGNNAETVWGTHIDIDDPAPANVLIFVRAAVPREKIIDEINKAQTFFREQIEPNND